MGKIQLTRGDRVLLGISAANMALIGPVHEDSRLRS
jgi:hypothetical protein